MTSPSFLFNADSAREIRECIATRNRPMLTGLAICIEQLERFAENDPDVQRALQWATKATALERRFQEGTDWQAAAAPDP